MKGSQYVSPCETMLSHLAYFIFDDIYNSFISKANDDQSYIKVNLLKTEENKRKRNSVRVTIVNR